MSQQFRNFEASERRRNMIPFGLFPSGEDLSWIGSMDYIPGTATVAYSTPLAINAATAQSQIITLTGDLNITSILYNGSTPTEPTALRLEFRQDATGGRLVTFPAELALYPGFQISLDPDARTILNLIYLDDRWEPSVPPVINPA